MRRYIRLAQITKPKGLKGEVVAVPADGLPFALRPGLAVWVVPPTLRGIRQTRVAQVRELARGFGVMLEGCESLQQSGDLAGRYLLARADDVGPLQPVQTAGGQDWEGMHVTDTRFGYLGIIQHSIITKAHPILVIEGGYGEVMVPAVDEFIIMVEDDSMTVSLPDGLLDLNQGRGGDEHI